MKINNFLPKCIFIYCKASEQFSFSVFVILSIVHGDSLFLLI